MQAIFCSLQLMHQEMKRAPHFHAAPVLKDYCLSAMVTTYVPAIITSRAITKLIEGISASFSDDESDDKGA